MISMFDRLCISIKLVLTKWDSIPTIQIANEEGEWCVDECMFMYVCNRVYTRYPFKKNNQNPNGFNNLVKCDQERRRIKTRYNISLLIKLIGF